MIDCRFIHFLLAGGVNTLFGYAAYSVLIVLGLPLQAALALGMIAGILFNFLMTSAVFASLDRRRLPRFLIAYGVFYLINSWLLSFLVRVGIGPIIGQGLITLLFAPLNFLVMRHFVFVQASERRS